MTPTTLIEQICSVWRISPSNITRQARGYCEPRYAYFFLMRVLYPDMSLRLIGELNDRNYTGPAVHYAIARHHALVATDVEYLIRFREIEDLVFKKVAA